MFAPTLSAMTKFPIFKEVPTMLIRNAKDSAGKAIEVWLRDGKMAAVGLGLLVPEARVSCRL